MHLTSLSSPTYPENDNIKSQFSWFTSDGAVLTLSSPPFSSHLWVETFSPIPQLSWTYKVSNPPIKPQRWNGFRSLAFQDVLKSHLSAFLSVSTLTFVSLEACCWGWIDGSVQQDRDEWKIFTASIDQPHSANSCNGSAGPWHAGFFYYIGPETRQAERMEGGGIEV